MLIMKMMRANTNSICLLWGFLLVVGRKVVSGQHPSSITSRAVWDDVARIQTTIQEQRQIQEQQHRNLQLGLDTICDMVVHLVDGFAPTSGSRECKCTFFPRQTLDCSYQQVTCEDKILPTMDVKFITGMTGSSVEICQSFQEHETFPPVCVEADLNSEMQYSQCNGATMGGTSCSCSACDDGLTLDIDCSDQHPLAKTEGCQPVFFQDKCLDFMPTTTTTTTTAPTEAESVAEPDFEDEVTFQPGTADADTDSATDLIPESGGIVPPNLVESHEFVAPSLANATSNQTDVMMEEMSDVTSRASLLEEEELNDEFMAGLVTDVPSSSPTKSRPSPQEEAREWLQQDPNLQYYTSSKQIQRYAMAVLYFATTRKSDYWFHSDKWLDYEEDECDWFTNSSEYPCDPTSGALEILDLSENTLTGQLPDELGLLRSLKHVLLPNNFFHGTLPSQIGSLTMLVDFDVSASDLKGRIPSEVGLMTNLESVSLQFNWMNGPLPSELGLLTNAYTLELYGNNFRGPFPSELCDLMEGYGTNVLVDCDGTLNCTCGCTCA